MTTRRKGARRKVAIVGKGALGIMFATLSQDALGRDEVSFVMDETRYSRHAGEQISVNGISHVFRDECIDDLVAAGMSADVILIATKTTTLDDALDLIEPIVDEATCLVPLLNGVTSEQRVADRFGWESTVGCFAIGVAAEYDGVQAVFSHKGYLCLGALHPESQPALEKAARMFEQVAIPVRVSADFAREQWYKFMMNVGLNQTTAVFDMTNGQVSDEANGEAFRLLIAAMREVQAVAHAEGIELTEDDLNHIINQVRQHPDSHPSMQQDCTLHRKTEVEEFSGVVMQLAAKHGLYVPTNRYLHERIKEIEARYLS